VGDSQAESSAEEAPEPARGVTIHVPGDDLGRDGKAEPAVQAPAETEPQAAEEPTPSAAGAESEAESGAETEEAPKPKKKTRRGSRGGKSRKKKPAAMSENGAEAAPSVEAAPAEAAPEAETPPENGDFDYVPMSEWADELEPKG
jgi:hypothetical protein